MNASLLLQSAAEWKFWLIRTALVDLLTQALMVGEAALTTLATPMIRSAPAIRAANDIRKRVGDIRLVIVPPS
ncbi:MAG TPA: hypothetical protein VGQ31_14140 [Candidatus Limnocylindrales bacterium]|nr:hypothetical protein [Candidatus Limnocylindrales bacterium]